MGISLILGGWSLLFCIPFCFIPNLGTPNPFCFVRFVLLNLCDKREQKKMNGHSRNGTMFILYPKWKYILFFERTRCSFFSRSNVPQNYYWRSNRIHADRRTSHLRTSIFFGINQPSFRFRTSTTSTRTVFDFSSKTEKLLQLSPR